MTDCLKYKTETGYIIGKSKNFPKEQLEYMDTGHDFFRGERGELIQDVLKSIYDPEKYVKKHAGYKKKLSGQFEPELESFFDVKYKYPSLCESEKYGKVYWTIEELMDDFSKQKEFETTIITNPLITAIQLQIPNGSDKKQLFKKAEKPDSKEFKQMNYVAGCIIKFFASGPLTDNDLTLVTIDSNSGALPYIFQTSGVKINTNSNALTICDSASGGVNESASSKYRISNFTKKYQPLLFPFNIVSVIKEEEAKAKEQNPRLTALNEIFTTYKKRAYIIQSNLFTRETHILYYTEDQLPFSIYNPCSIVFRVKVIGVAGGEYYAPFVHSSPGKVQSGTPVSVLRKLIRTLQDSWGKDSLIRELETIGNESDRFNIVPIVKDMKIKGENKETIQKVLLDYKRGGDHEQINGMDQTNSETGCKLQFFATGDNFARTKANEKKKNSAYTHGDKLDLCRHPSQLLSPEKIAILKKSAEITNLTQALQNREQQIEEIRHRVGVQLIELLKIFKPWILEIINYYQEKQPLTSLIFSGLKHKIDTYLTPTTTELFGSYISKINLVVNTGQANAESVEELSEELSFFFDNFDEMRRYENKLATAKVPSLGNHDNPTKKTN